MIIETDMAQDEFLEHYGVKGMKWGVRRTRRIQGHIDRVAKVRDGTATTGERIRVATASGIVRQKGAERVLKRASNIQTRMLAGKHKAMRILLAAEGIRVVDLNYHQP